MGNVGLEQQRFEVFTRRTAPNRVETARLDLTRSEDRVQDAEEELHQLEIMYGEDDFAEKTKEIVLERGRRRLERSRVSFELQRQRFATLTEKTIPREISEHELSLERKAKALEKTQRSVEAARVDKDIELRTSRSEIMNQEADLEALHEKIAKNRKERDKAEREE